MSKERVIFRSSVNGYNKKDVYNYIEKLNNDIKSANESYEQKIKALEADKKEAESQLSAHNSENVSLKQRISELEDQIKEKDALLEELDHACVKISLELDTLSLQYSALVSKYDNVPCADAHVKELERKAKAYDKIIARAKEKQKEQKHIHSASTQAPAKDPATNNQTESAREILNEIANAQSKLTDAIEKAKAEADILRERLNRVISSSGK